MSAATTSRVHDGLTPIVPRLHPNLPEFYRAKVADLAQALGAEDGAEARGLARGLVEAIKLTPDDGRLAVVVRGELASILRLAAGAQRAGTPANIADTGVIVEQVKMVAGARNQLDLLLTG